MRLTEKSEEIGISCKEQLDIHYANAEKNNGMTALPEILLYRKSSL